MTLIKTSFPTWTGLSDFFDDDWFRTRFANGDWSPAVNVVENEDNYEVEVAAPGMKKGDFSVAVENGVLTISGKSEREEEEKKKNYTRREFTSRSFTKSFTLPENVREEHVTARYENGVLQLKLDKTAEELPPQRKVTVQ